MPSDDTESVLDAPVLPGSSPRHCIAERWGHRTLLGQRRVQPLHTLSLTLDM